MIFDGRTAFVSGGGDGIGRALCQALAARGMAVVVADIDGASAAAVADGIVSSGGRASGIACDVSSREDVERAAQRTIAAFGKVHVVCNNAGVALTGKIGSFSAKDWRWVFDVNLMGMIHGTETFLPLLRSHGEGGHFLNTASVGGFLSGPMGEAYAASKHAIVALSEGWAMQLAPEGIRVSILCPHFVRTGIAASENKRPAHYTTGQDRAADDYSSRAIRGVETGLSPAVVAERAIEGMAAGELHIFTHPTARAPLEAYFTSILAAVDRTGQSTALAGVKTWPPFVPE